MEEKITKPQKNMTKTKGILTTLRRFFVLTTIAVIGTVASYADTDTWDGTTPATLSDAGITGTGQSGNPYVINSAKAFAFFGSVMNGNASHWEIVQNLEIDLAGKTWTYGTTQGAQYFKGTLNGQGATVKNFKLDVNNNTVGGLFSGITGTVENLHVSNVTLTDGHKWNACSYGILAGELYGGTISTCSVESATMTFTGSASLYGNIFAIGGMVGKVTGTGSKIENSKVVDLTITTGTTSCGGTHVFVGGVAGSVGSVSNLNRCGAKDCNIQIKYTDTNQLPVGHVSLGGVIGNIIQPCSEMPEDLCAYNCKLYCPVGSVGPVCGMFLKNSGTSDATVTDDYSAENGEVSSVNRAKTSSWMYNGYKLGVHSGAQNKDNTNFDTKKLVRENGIDYLTVAEPYNTFTNQNSVNNSPRSSYTVRWYDSSGNNTTTSVYPSYGNPWLTGRNVWPLGYCYFMQGYNVGSYVSDAQASAFIEALANVKKRATLTLTDENLGQRGICNHTIKLDVVKGDDADITWTWYVDGVAKENGTTSTTLNVAPKYSGPVNVVVMSTDGASTSLTLPKAYLATLYSPHYKSGSLAPTSQVGTIEDDNRTRGTKDNPYVIGSEEELRLWSEYSRLNGTVENGIVGGVVVEDNANHFNTSNFWLVRDIDMEAHTTDIETEVFKGVTVDWSTHHKFNPEDHFEPICAFSNEDIYDLEHTFRGTFDGKSHIISGLHQIWRGGMLNMTYAEQGTMSWGLFGVVGGDANHPAVIRNVIIKDAMFEHDTYKGSFSYKANVEDANAPTKLTDFNDTRGTNVAVGTLAGMVTRYSTIQNIDVRNSAIYASSSDQSLMRTQWSVIDVAWNKAVYHLWVGGVIGRVQAAYDTPHGDVGGSVDLKYLSVDVDLDVFPICVKGGNINAGWEAPYNTYNSRARRLSAYNMGGIVGSMYSSGGASSLPWPQSAFFTGQMRAMVCMSGPIFGYVNYGSMTENITSPAQAHEHWCGPENAIPTGYYNNYYLRDTKGDEEQWAWTQVTNTTYNIYQKGAWRKHATAGMLWQSRSSGGANNNTDTTNGKADNTTTIDGGRVGSAWYNKQNVNAAIQTVCGTTGTVPAGMLWYVGPLTPEKPQNPLFACGSNGYEGALSLRKHNETTGSLEGEDDLSGYYQGINAGTWKDWTLEANQTNVIDEFNGNNEYVWSWDPETGRPILTPKNAERLEASADKDTPTSLKAELKGVSTGVEGFTYAWYNKCGSVKVQDFKDATNGGDKLTVTQENYDQVFYAVAKNGNDPSENGYKEFTSGLVTVPGKYQASDITATVDVQVNNIAETSYNTHEAYIGVRISQEEYYKLPENIRQKTPASYYGYDDYKKWFHDYSYSLYRLEFDSLTNTYKERPEKWNTQYTDSSYTTQADSIAAYQAHFEQVNGVWVPKNDAVSQKMLLRIPAIMYTYNEFLTLDVRTDTYDADDAPNYGYTYTFNGETSHVAAGYSYPNRNVTPTEYNSADKSIPAKTETTLTATLEPSASVLTGAGYAITYQWYILGGEAIEGATNATYVVTNDANADRGAYECRIKVVDEQTCIKRTLYNGVVSKSWGKTYVYINPEGVEIDYTGTESHGKTKPGNDANDGLTPETPVKTWPRAYSLLKEKGTWDENQIILIGKSPAATTREGFGLGTSDFNGNNTTGLYDVWYNRAASKFMNRNATISSKRQDGATFQGDFEMENSAGNGTQTALFGDTRFENMTFSHVSNSGGGYGIIACQYHNLEMGEGLIMERFPSASSASAEVGPLPGTKIADLQIFGGCNNDSRFLRMGGSVANYEVDEYIPHPEGFTITVKSGFYSNICASGRQSTNSDLNGMVGTPNRPIKCNIVIDIDRKSNNDHVDYGNSSASYDVGAVMAGNHEGAQYGDVNIIIRSGIIGRVTSGSLGNKRMAGTFGTNTEAGFRTYKTYYGTEKDEYMPFDTYFGRCNILVDPKSSKMNDDTDINKRVVISELYGGALGRHMGNTNNGVCMSTFYGKTYITINGGTFDLNTVADNTSSPSMEGNGMYGLKSYGQQTQKTNEKTYYRAQPGIYAAGAGGFNGIGSDELHTNDLRLPYWDKAKEYTPGSNQDYVKSSLRAKGVIDPERVVRYGNYSTYKSKVGDDKVYILCLDSIVDGTRYETRIDPAETSTTITINGGNFFPRWLPQGAGIYGAGNGFVNNQLINFANQAPNPLGGSLLGKPGTTAVEININGGTFNCNVYGGGRGNDIYYVAGLHYAGNEGSIGGSNTAQGDHVVTNVSDPNYESFGVTRDNYSRNARIVGNVVMNINGGLFKQNIYGSGSGSTTAGCERMAEVIGNTTINITSDSSLVHILGNVYGGGENARVRQTTSVNVDEGVIYGSVFGGGDNAIVGLIEEQPLYTADSYWQKSDNDKAAWVDENGNQMSDTDISDNIERNNVIRKGTATEYVEYGVGDLKPELQRHIIPGGIHRVGTGRTSVYTKTNAAYVYGDIYGGGNKADVNGDTYVGMSAGHVGGSIFGGGNGIYDTNPANVHGFTEVFLNGYTVMWDRMFDINAWNTLSYNDKSQKNDIDAIESTYIKKWADAKSKFILSESDKKPVWLDPHGGRNAHNVFGGGNIYCAVDSMARVTVTRGMTPKALLETDEWKDSYYDNDNPHFYVFGGGYGEHTTVQNTYVNVGMEGVLTEDATTTEALAKASSVFIDEDGNAVTAAGDQNHNIGIFSNGYGIAGYTVLGVLGGGMEGIVNDDTEVIIGGNTFIHRVYGGGYGKRNRSAYTEATDLGRVKGHTRVKANGGLINGDIFGGGARGDVDSTTYVEILRDCKVYGSVFGGGDVASVGDANYRISTTEDTISTVVAAGGIVYHNAFAGGSQGPIYGTTLINVTDSLMNGKSVVPYIYGDIYGGGEKANITGNSNVLIEGGMLAGDIFGGGLGTHTDNGDAANAAANIQGDANIKVNGGSIMWDQQCDDYRHGTVYFFDNTAVISNDSFKKGEVTADDLKGAEGFYDFATGHFTRNHNVYGGGNVNSTVSGNTNVTLNHGLVTSGLQYYDNPTLSPFAVLWYNVIQNKSYPQFSVLGGGYGKNTLVGRNTNVSMNVANYIEPEATATQAEKDAYAAYKSYKAYEEDYGQFRMFENELLSRWEALAEEQKLLLYGGVNANVYRRYRASRYAWSGGVHGHVMANVYGGSWAGKVAGDASVVLDGTSGCRNVFGGGVGMATASANNDKLGEVLGKATVTVNGAIISGDVYGGGAGVESALNASGAPEFDYNNVARVVNSTDVTIQGEVTTTTVGEYDENGEYVEGSRSYPVDGTLIYGSVSGGGDVANVGSYANPTTAPSEETAPVTSVTINGGLVFSQIYAGGTGRQSSLCKDYTSVGAVYGNTKLSVNTPAGELNAPWLWNRLYGGGMCGTVYGNTKVDIAGGNYGYNIFGGGFGRVDTLETDKSLVLTDAAVKGNTRVNVTGGEWCVSQMWVTVDENGNDVRAWAPSSTYGNKTYSSQYDPEYKRFKINHNIYGGGNACSTIGGSTYVNIAKGMLSYNTPIGRDYTYDSFFKEHEWKESYDKVGSAHFSVFGAGYGVKTLVTGDTHVDVSIEGDTIPSAGFENDSIPYYQRFVSLQSLLDVIGGGYRGQVNGVTNVHIGGNSFLRRVFTGGYYAPVKESNLLVTSGDLDEVFGGGLIGNVDENTYLQVGWREAVTFDGKEYDTNDNAKLFVNKNVYGGNDVSGTIGYKDEKHTEGQGTHLKMYGGNLYGDVYGGGNGNYLYALGQNGETEVTPNEHYLKTENFEGYDLVYTVPMRPGMISSSFASDAQKIVNISSFRPSTIEANIELYGRSDDDRLVIKGNVFGGGNCATVDGVVDNRGNNSARVNFKIKDNIKVGGVFLGSDGDALFVDSENNPFLSQFQTINNINLEDTVIWDTDPANHGIKLKYLAVENEDRPIVYPHLLDLYFQPVEMSIQPTVKWGTSESETGAINNATIGIFCCGGNRGNMNVYPSTANDNRGNVVDITFPKDLVITGHIIGGCNNANYVWTNSATGNTTKHTGGYLLGERKSENPMIKILVRNKFQPTPKEFIVDGNSHYEYTGGNVYGGCYKSGTINGDVTVDLRSNMLKGLRTDYFKEITDIGAGSCNVYGAGYGTNSYVYGDTKVIVGAETNCKTKTDSVSVSNSNPAKGNAPLVANASYEVFDDEGTSACFIFGGGLQGNVVGNATVRYLNGHTLNSVTGGSYAGYLWGSTQVIVGYPDYYTVKDGMQGVYTVARKDKSSDNLAQTTVNVKGDTEKAIKQEIKLMAGDIIAPTLYEAIVEANPDFAVEKSGTPFTKVPATEPTMGWDNVDITIDEAVYGGGYSLASATSVMANNTIVLKYTDQYNTDDETTTLSSVGYGGNTTMVVWDKVEYDNNGYVIQPGDDVDKDIDHVTISQQEMTEVDLPHGTDLFGYYYKDRYGHYHYIYEENKYFQGLEYPKPPLYTGTYVSAYDFEAEGGLYGDGHLSFSEGFRTGEIKGYGFNGGRTIEGARLMNSMQRMDILRIEDCNLILLGARDYATNVTNTTPYSMSRIGELQMISHIDDRADLLSVSHITMEDSIQGAKAARNFVGLSNNILYVGCIYTNTPFSDKWHNHKNAIAVANDTTYQQMKQDYITKFYKEKSIEEDEFQKRNDGTAKNMIGVSSGYALKIQNLTSRAVGKSVEGTSNVTTQVDSVFYGPIVGVAEVNLMSSRLNEGGGYIYADNIHDRAEDDATSSNGTGNPDFLMTTGNFVFPHSEAGRYILDDCYVKTYDQSLGANPPTEAEPAHYWYILGYNYFYNLHITGYTSDSRDKPLEFNADNTDLLSIMKGAKAGQKVTLHSIRWRSEHVGTDTSDDKYDECDIDGNYKATGVYPASMTKGAETYGNATLNQRWNDTYYKLRLSAFDDTTLVYRETPVEVDGSTKTPVHGDLQRAKNMTSPTPLTGELLTDEPVIALQLVDAVDNTTEAYYKKHLSETCKATIVLTVPAHDQNGNEITGETSVTAIYTNDNHVGLEDKVTPGVNLKLDNSIPYYYFDDNLHEYRPLDMTKLRYHWGSGTSLDNFAPITSLKTNNDGQFVLTYDDGKGHSGSQTVTNIYVEGLRNYTYTLYLTIDYVQGPEVRGHITIHNCALPGEMVRLTTENVKSTADESMRPINTYWRIGMRKYDETSRKWVFADETEWTPVTSTVEGAPEGYDSYNVNSETKNGVFQGAVYDQTEGYLDVPVYYFMNGYGVQYGIEFNGLEGQIFPVSMAESDSLLIHNFHRMATHSTNKSLHLHLSEAAARAKAYEDYVAYLQKMKDDGYSLMSTEEKEAWDAANKKTYVAPLSRPRIYIEDEVDMNAFYQFIDSVGRYDEQNYITEAQIGTKKYDVPTGGKYMQFFVQDNIAFSKEYYHSPKEDFEGELDGRGHTIDLTNKLRVTDANAPALLKNVVGGVYNLGVLGKPLAQSLADDNNKHVFNSFVYGMDGKNAVTIVKDAETAGNTGLDNSYDLSVADDADFKYGRIAYNLNKYYLAERYRRGAKLLASNDRIEQYFANEDFQYAHRKDELTGKKTGLTYLRTSTLDLPAYGSYETRHDKSHGIDEARAVITYLTEAEANALNEKYNLEYAYEIDPVSGSPKTLTKDPYSTSTIKSVRYKALFNESHADKDHGTDDNLLRNDYILFGQNLTETPDALPTNIASGLNSEATNRVWRASGFYGSKKDEGFYYNAMTNMATMVNDPRLTAVDLTCQRDGDITAASYQNDAANTLTSVSGAATAEQSVFFAPTGDMPSDASYWKFGVAEAQLDGTHVTQNLLVYTAGSTNAAAKVKDAIEYTAETSTDDILGHRIVVGTPNHSAPLLHLVDKENFNAPMAFVADNAWYDRNPSMETGYVEAAGQGWESVALPYTVQKTTLSTPIERFYDYADEKANPEHKRNTKKEDQSEISFFYGAQDNVEDNPHIINHEYWLRNLTGVDRPEAAGTKLSGIFKRPVKSQENGGFAAYTPFVVSFPGSPFYEFDMTGRTITFSAVNANVDITDDAVEENKVAKVSGTRSYTHYAAFMNEAGDETGTYAIALKSAADDTENIGDKFTIGAPVYPFRAKIVADGVSNTGGAKAASYADMQEDAPEAIYISTLGIGLEEKGISEPETEEVIESNGMRIYPSGKRIVVESTYATTVNVYSANGKLVRVLDVRPGTSIFSGFATGIYVVEQKTMSLK